MASKGARHGVRVKGGGGSRLRAVPFKADYGVTREQLIAYGISERMITLAEQPFIRPGAQDFDIAYALEIWEWRDRIALAALRINNPDSPHVFFPPESPQRGNVK